ncbi:SDR family NAD(P)-dependent oxidoreductase [Pseudactinotalea terrae]|uniref:SDR family NAD(P)-dependent oxidoreductase n=1 Tax=Pseudactinotalea terrae TaxID=1743262 RepID=UPI0012E2630E|nr:SDR family NAD(P)-dependent oxidoreductase [Pseudactinotalea terrae]
MSTALITGGNRGLGRAVAEALASRGTRVVIAARDAQAGAAAAAQIGGATMSVQLDVTDPASVRSAAAWLEEAVGGIDVLINNAGVLPEGSAEVGEVVDLELFEQTYATNLLGVVSVTQAFLPQLRRSAGGRIVNVSSTMGSIADQTNPASPYYGTVVPAYQSSKAALNSVTISLAKALASTPIKVTSVCPGFVQTDLTPISREQAPLTASQGAAVVVEAGMLPDDAASGTFIDSSGVVAW